MKAIVSFMLLCSLTFGATGKKGGVFTTVGGEGSCGNFIAKYGKDDLVDKMFGIYIVGFVSGSSYVVSRKLSLDLDSNALLHWVVNYCKANPLVPFVHAVANLDDELDRKYSVE